MFMHSPPPHPLPHPTPHPTPPQVARPLPSSVCEVVCPWWQKPYGEQLAIKAQKVGEALEAVAAEVSLAWP